MLYMDGANGAVRNLGDKRMTKFETKQAAIIEAHVNAGNDVSAARILSSLIRVSRTEKSRRDLIALAEGLRLAGHVEFRI
jgi:hypothetical protein